MRGDHDLQELRRRVDAEPGETSARLALGQALVRAGRQDDGVEELLRVCAQGGAALARGPLEALGLAATPWSLPHGGDPGLTSCAPVTGPRRGEVLARSDADVGRSLVIDVDGSVIVGAAERLTRLDGRTLALRRKWSFSAETRELVAPAITGGGALLALATHGERWLRAADEARERFAPRSLPRAASASWVSWVPGRIVVGLLRPGQRGAGGVALVDEAGGPTLELALDSSGTILPATDTSLVALSDDTLRFVPLDGSATTTLPLKEGATRRGARVVVARDRSLRIVLPFALAALRVDPGGRTRWRTGLELRDATSAGVAVCGDGSTVIATRTAVLRLDADGAVQWRADVAAYADAGLVVDRGGFSYLVASAASGSGLTCLSPSGERVFHVPEVERVLALDARGRVLALQHRRVVAIG